MCSYIMYCVHFYQNIIKFLCNLMLLHLFLIILHLLLAMHYILSQLGPFCTINNFLLRAFLSPYYWTMEICILCYHHFMTLFTILLLRALFVLRIFTLWVIMKILAISEHFSIYFLLLRIYIVTLLNNSNFPLRYRFFEH